MSKKVIIILALSLLLPAVGCVTTEDFARQNQRLNQLQQEVQSLKKALQVKDMETERLLGQTRGTLPELNLRVDQLQAEVQKIVDAVELAEQQAGGTDTGSLGLRIQLDHIRARLDRLEAALKLPRLDVKVIQEAQQAEQALSEHIRGPGEEVGESQPVGPEQDAYQTALKTFKAKSYPEAQKQFEAFLAQYPDSGDADSAKFFIGECLYYEKNYEEAILAYQKVIDGHPKSQKVPTALLKQALAFLNIGDNTSGKLLLQKLVKEYKGSQAAEVAAKKLRTLK
ncbi:MAG: tol-pal system protein YbgF [Thermodesulfobacteriota bacterium]